MTDLNFTSSFQINCVSSEFTKGKSGKLCMKSFLLF